MEHSDSADHRQGEFGRDTGSDPDTDQVTSRIQEDKSVRSEQSLLHEEQTERKRKTNSRYYNLLGKSI